MALQLRSLVDAEPGLAAAAIDSPCLDGPPEVVESRSRQAASELLPGVPLIPRCHNRIEQFRYRQVADIVRAPGGGGGGRRAENRGHTPYLSANPSLLTRLGGLS